MTQFVQVDWTAHAEEMDVIRKKMSSPDLQAPFDVQNAIERMSSALWVICTSKALQTGVPVDHEHG